MNLLIGIVLERVWPFRTNKRIYLAINEWLIGFIYFCKYYTRNFMNTIIVSVSKCESITFLERTGLTPHARFSKSKSGHDYEKILKIKDNTT